LPSSCRLLTLAALVGCLAPETVELPAEAPVAAFPVGEASSPDCVTLRAHLTELAPQLAEGVRMVLRAEPLEGEAEASRCRALGAATIEGLQTFVATGQLPGSAGPG